MLYFVCIEYTRYFFNTKYQVKAIVIGIFEANLWLKSVDYCKVCIYKYPSLVDHKLDTKNYPPITIPPYPLLHSHTVHNSSTLPKESVESTPIIQY